MTNVSKGLALVEFHSVEYAAHTLSNSSALSLDGRPLRVHFAKESFKLDTIASTQTYALQSAYAAVALQVNFH